MARTYAKLLSSIWQDTDFTRLPASAQRLYLLLVSQRTINLCGVIDLTPRRWASCAHDTTPDDVDEDLAALEQARFVVIDPDTDEVWVRSFIKHDVAGSGNVVKGFWSDHDEVVSAHLRDLICAEAAQFDDIWNLRPDSIDAPTPDPTPVPNREASGKAMSVGTAVSGSLQPSACEILPSVESHAAGELENRAPPPLRGDPPGAQVAAAKSTPAAAQSRAPAKQRKARARDPVWDASCECEPVTNDAERKARNEACRLLRQSLDGAGIADDYATRHAAVLELWDRYPDAMPPGNRRTFNAVARNVGKVLNHAVGRNTPKTEVVGYGVVG